MNPNLSAYIRRYIEISEAEDVVFQSFLKTKSFKKKEYLLKGGQICKSRYFIKKGCLRLFYIDPKGNEQIIHFGIENWWITDYDSLINKQPSKIYIQALEDTEVLILEESVFESLMQKIPQTERLFRKIMEKSYVALQRRFEYSLSLSGEDFYETFIAANSSFAQRIPQYMLASYLGFTPEFVSKLRGKKK